MSDLIRAWAYLEFLRGEQTDERKPNQWLLGILIACAVTLVVLVWRAIL